MSKYGVFSHRPRRRCPDFHRAPVRRCLRFLGAEIPCAFAPTKIRAGNVQVAPEISICPPPLGDISRGLRRQPPYLWLGETNAKKANQKTALAPFSKQTWPLACILSETRFLRVAGWTEAGGETPRGVWLLFVFCLRRFWLRPNLHERDNPKTIIHATAPNPRQRTPDAHTASGKASIRRATTRSSLTIKRQDRYRIQMGKTREQRKDAKCVSKNRALRNRADPRNFQLVILYLNFGYK